jgi:hypothetical protein
MTLKDIDAFLKSEEPTVSTRLTAVETKAAPPSEAQAYLDRAEAFARVNPGEHLLAAVRFFEVADRFKDTDAGRAAMGKSLAEMQQVVSQKGKLEKPPVTRLGKPVNLLALIDCARDAVAGKWAFIGPVLVGEKAEFARLEIPYDVPREYDFKIVFMRMEGNDNVSQILQGFGHQFLWSIEGDNGNATGFDAVNGLDFKKNPSTFRGSLLKNGQWHTSLIRVRGDGVTALVDGKEIAQVQTVTYENMTIFPGWKLRDRTLIGVGHCDNKVAFKTIELIPVDGNADATVNGAKSVTTEKANSASQKNVPKKINKINLLALVDPTKDAIEGKLQFINSALISGSEKSEYCKFSIPYIPPEEYDFSVEFMRLKGSDCVQFVLSKGGIQFMYVLGGNGGKASGFDVVDGKSFDKNDSTYLGKVITDGRRQVIIIKVRNNGVTAFLDGTQLSQTKVPYEKLTMHDDWRIRRNEILGLSNYRGSWAFYSVELMEITGEGLKDR